MRKIGFKKIFSGSLGFYFVGANLIGFLDSFYLTVKHYLNSPLNCSVLAGCDKVTASAYAEIYGVPVPLLGVIFYLAFFILFFVFSFSPSEGRFKKKRIARFMVFAAFLGVAFSAWLLFLQIAVIKALCLYCLVSDTAAAIIFVLSMILLFRYKEK
ncbi:vitamin K epoxide reductase family protein [Patescibacteria group bacterium]|nr:vitamin K epoxide reductase family protein [Patescibacteria group bacterium]MCL5733184.1 vitamin K epoxide reductase family protein [Patescibacteria group bacterium]